jgi:hypothetical protein
MLKPTPNPTMQEYRDQLVDKLSEDTCTSEASAQTFTLRLNDNEVFELLSIEPDQQALTAAESDRAVKHEEEQQTAVKNARYEQLSKLKGAQRIAALLGSSAGDSSILPTTQQSQLQAGELTGHDRLTAIFNIQSHNA